MYELNTVKKREIFRQFLFNKKLRFNEIEKLTKIRSNELAYFLEKLIDHDVLKKNEEFYELSETYEKFIPFFSEQLSPLPVVLIACIKDNRILLYEREKRPYENHWGLVGGKIYLNETVHTGAKRMLKEKTYLDGEVVSINSVVHEQVKEDDEVKHAYFLFFVVMELSSEIKEKQNIKWFDLNEVDKLKIIPSDLWLIQNKLNSKIDIMEEFIVENNDSLKMQMCVN